MTHVSVTVGDGHREHMDGVVETLRERGLQVEQVLCTLGVVTGMAPAESLDVLRSVEGVDSVDEELTFRIAPPDSPVQ